VSKPPKADLAALQQQVADLTEALQRERADATNLRRRYDTQLTSLKIAAKASVVRDLLPIIDNFERALKHTPSELADNDYVKAIQTIVKQFEKVLEQLGVKKIKTAGEPFDPHLHEAVSMEDGDGDQEIISEELQSGYTLEGEVLRHAMVRVKMQ
jgi:molecular chaperone GrpE